MTTKVLDGDRALAWGAIRAGVGLVASYPGSPSSGTVEALLALNGHHDMDVEWSVNERVGAELGIGASIAGYRALVCAKSVGMNVMLDPLMALNLTPIQGGLVFLLGDDPGGYGSQNDQDTRPLAVLLEWPLWEPSTPQQGYQMMVEAFSASEAIGTPVVIRETRSFAHCRGTVAVDSAPYRKPCRGIAREPLRFVPVPKNAVAKHRHLHRQLRQWRRRHEEMAEQAVSGEGRLGIIAAGFAHSKLIDVLGRQPRKDCRVLELATLYPLPERRIAAFVAACRSVLIVEEIEPFVEHQIRALAQTMGLTVPILGKEESGLAREGELFRWQIKDAVQRFLGSAAPLQPYHRQGQDREKPPKEDHCSGNAYGEVLTCLEDAAQEAGIELFVVADPGCLVTVADRLDAKYAIGSAAGVAAGLARTSEDVFPVAMFGDSAFYHMAIPAICNAAWHGDRFLIVVLDNGATATSGFQPNPGTGRNAAGRSATRLEMAEIARSCGVTEVATHRLGEPLESLRRRFGEALRQGGLAMIIVETVWHTPAGDHSQRRA